MAEATDNNNVSHKSSNTTLSASEQLLQKLDMECHEMASYALSKGITIPPKLTSILVNETQDNDESLSQKVSKLTTVHNRLAELVSPAKPEAIMLMAEEQRKGSPFLFLGKVPLIRRMMLVAIVSLFILIS